MIEKKNNQQEKICSVCGKTFTIDKPQQKYCSKECALKSKADYMREYWNGYIRKDRLNKKKV